MDVDGAVVMSHATSEVVRGKHVYGVLPLHLAAEAETVTTIDLPDLPPERRGQELTVAEMDAYGARMSTYVVRRVE